jgi:hypothetical protein
MVLFFVLGFRFRRAWSLTRRDGGSVEGRSSREVRFAPINGHSLVKTPMAESCQKQKFQAFLSCMDSRVPIR